MDMSNMGVVVDETPAKIIVKGVETYEIPIEDIQEKGELFLRIRCDLQEFKKRYRILGEGYRIKEREK